MRILAGYCEHVKQPHYLCRFLGAYRVLSVTGGCQYCVTMVNELPQVTMKFDLKALALESHRDTRDMHNFVASRSGRVLALDLPTVWRDLNFLQSIGVNDYSFLVTESTLTLIDILSRYDRLR